VTKEYSRKLFSVFADVSEAGAKDIVIPFARQMMSAFNTGKLPYPQGLFSTRVKTHVLDAVKELNDLYVSLSRGASQ
jgi:hypothetical protein